MSTKPWAQGKQNRCREDMAAPCGTTHYRFISAGSGQNAQTRLFFLLILCGKDKAIYLGFF